MEGLLHQELQQEAALRANKANKILVKIKPFYKEIKTKERDGRKSRSQPYKHDKMTGKQHSVANLLKHMLLGKMQDPFINEPIY